MTAYKIVNCTAKRIILDLLFGFFHFIFSRSILHQIYISIKLSIVVL